MSEAIWYCMRQRAGPLVKECRALRPRLSKKDAPDDRRDKQQILKYQHSAVCRTQADRLELRLALFGYRGSHYTLTFDSASLPSTFAGVRQTLRPFRRGQNGGRAGFHTIGFMPLKGCTAIIAITSTRSCRMMRFLR